MCVQCTTVRVYVFFITFEMLLPVTALLLLLYMEYLVYKKKIKTIKRLVTLVEELGS